MYKIVKNTLSSPRPTLVLDLDETLIHTTLNPEVVHEGTITVKQETTCLTGYVCVRPCARAFLEEAAKRYELVIFTASEKDYADKVINLLDPERKLIKYRLYRSACVAFENTYIKDLSLLGRDLSKTIIVDNSLHSFAFQPENGIVIKHFIGDKSDQALNTLWGLLYSLSEFPDIRAALPSFFQQLNLLSFCLLSLTLFTQSFAKLFFLNLFIIVMRILFNIFLIFFYLFIIFQFYQITKIYYIYIQYYYMLLLYYLYITYVTDFIILCNIQFLIFYIFIKI